MKSKNKIDNIVNYTKNNKNNVNNINNVIISKNGYECLTPCVKPNTLFYNPITLQGIIEDYPSCPVYRKNKHDPLNIDQLVIYDKCNLNDNKKISYKEQHIFDDSLYFCNSANDFLIEIYNINNIIDVINFLNDDLNEIPDYSQKRLLDYIYEVYIEYDDFPYELFSQRLIEVFNKIYKIKLNYLKIYKNIKNKKKINIFDYLFNKYLK
jgi:hypothetical protein